MNNLKITETEMLLVDTFDGDFGDPSDRVIRDKIVTTRKAKVCHLCGQIIPKGARSRAMSGIFDGDFVTYRWCVDCLTAMVESETDGGEAFSKRIQLRNEAENEQTRCSVACIVRGPAGAERI